MKRTIWFLIGAIIFMVIAIHFGLKGGNALEVPEQNALQTDSTEGSEVASNVTTNLHFENLHANPTVQ